MPGFQISAVSGTTAAALISVISALSLFMLLAIAALIIDTGALYFQRRDQQAVTDAAALAAVQNPANAAAIAADVFSRNSYQGQALTVNAGTYTADEAVSAAGAFFAGRLGYERGPRQRPVFHGRLFCWSFLGWARRRW